MKPYRATIHCTDSENGKRVPISEIREWHLARGFRDVGYHAVIQPDGELERGRGLNEVGAHVEGDNDANVGICLVGKTRFTRAQFQRLRSFLDDLKMTYDIRPWAVTCHYQYKSAIAQGKTCPNIEINRLLAWYIGQFEEAIWPYLLEEIHGA